MGFPATILFRESCLSRNHSGLEPPPVRPWLATAAYGSKGSRVKRTTAAVVAFIGRTFLISWSSWGLVGLVDQDPGLNIGGVLWVIGGLGPAIAALGTVHLFVEGETPRSLLGRLAD